MAKAGGPSEPFELRATLTGVGVPQALPKTRSEKPLPLRSPSTDAALKPNGSPGDTCARSNVETGVVSPVGLPNETKPVSLAMNGGITVASNTWTPTFITTSANPSEFTSPHVGTQPMALPPVGIGATTAALLVAPPAPS